jgi:TetR/AcrR family transcriptional regulator, copper-responsive repressor
MTGDSTKRPRGRPKTFDRARTLDVAIDSYWRDGVDAVSVNEICRRAKISKPGLYREFGDEDHLMDAALTRYSETVLGPVLATLSDDRPFRETLDSLIDFATREETPDVPSGCLFAKMRNFRSQLGPVTRAHVDQLREDAVAAYAAWLERRAHHGEIELPAPLEITAAYVDAQLTMMLTRSSAGEDPELVRAHAHLAFAVLTNPTSIAEPVNLVGSVSCFDR